jgi:uncharacterized protein YegJ (DUF2314 family)
MPVSPKVLLFGILALALAGALIVAVALRRVARERSDGKIVSLVFLLRAPRALELTQIKSAAERAFGKVIEENDADFAVIPTDKRGRFLIKTPDVALGVASIEGTYVRDVAAAADQARDFRCKLALQKHQAWLAVDQIGEPPAGGTSVSYKYIGKLMAELAGDDCLALYCPETQQMNSYGWDLVPILRSADPLAALTYPREDKAVSVQAEDPEMNAAIAEARRRLPEFLSAFKKRRPLQGFAVKVPFRAGETNEHMWVEVLRLDGKVVHGKLVSEPKLVSNFKLDDEVTVNLDDITDWIFSDGKEMVGGFTSKVLEQRQ